jgi:parvulin-like peptidyl-prolyl isomerase
MNFNLRILSSLFFAGIISLSLHAQESVDATETAQSGGILAIQGDVILTQDEIDAAFSRIPPEHRLLFIRDGERVNQLVQSLLAIKVVAADAYGAGYENDRLAKSRMALAAEKELGEAWMERVMENAPEADYAALAYENYLANPEVYQTEAIVDVSHILIATEDRSNEEALELALSLREQVLEDPSRFDGFIEEFSDDPGKSMNQGRYPLVKRGQMVKPFEDMAFSMKNQGDISEPVKTDYGYHLIRLNNSFPPRTQAFEDVKADVMTRAREQYLAKYRSRYLKKLLSEPIEMPAGAVEAMARRYFGDDLEMAPNLLQ